MYILLCGYPPFDGINEADIIEKVKIGKYTITEEPWPKITPEAKSLITHLLQPAQSRISALEALQHPWIVSNAQRVLPSEDVYS